MGEETTRSEIKSALRMLWLRSKERSAALKRDGYACTECHVKQSKAKGKEQKVEVHHKNGINNWDEVIDMIKAKILCNPDDLQTLCPNCHERITATSFS